MVGPQLLTAASLGCAIAALVCAWRVYERRLVNVYPGFFAYLVSQGAVIATSSLIGTGSRSYVSVFLVAYPITLVVYCFMVSELYSHIFTNYPGIAMFGKWCIYGAIAAAFGAAAVSKSLTRAPLANIRTRFVMVESAGQTVVFGMAILLILLMLAISRYPLKLHQNVILNAVLFSVLLLTEAGVSLADHLTSLRHTTWMDVGMVIFNGVCFGLWAWSLSREGETRTIRIRHGFHKGEESRLLGQLALLNSIGLRISRK